MLMLWNISLVVYMYIIKHKKVMLIYYGKNVEEI